MLKILMNRMNIFLIASLVLLSNYGLSQGYYGMPSILAKNVADQNRAPTVEEIYDNYANLLANQDTTLNSQKRKASRWMAYVFPYLTVENGNITGNHDFTNAMKSIFNSTLSCDDVDLADWVPDGPQHIPDWYPSRMAGGRVDAIYNNPSDLDEMACGTFTSGIFWSEDGGTSWECVTDDLSFPVLGVMQIIPALDDDEHLLAISGNRFIEGGIIISDDAGENWVQAQTDIPEQPYWLEYHPTISGLVFAAAKSNIYYSNDDGLNWQTIALPPGYDPLHKRFYNVMVSDDNIFFASGKNYVAGDQLFKGSMQITGGIVSVTYNGSGEISSDFVLNGDFINIVEFSNKKGLEFYLHVQSKHYSCVPCNDCDDCPDSDLGFCGTCESPQGYPEGGTEQNILYHTVDGGDTFSQVNSNIPLSTTLTNILIMSPNNSDILYRGGVGKIKRYNVSNNQTQTFFTPAGNSGHHDDYRTFQIIDTGIEDRILVGHDGGVGLATNGLALNPVLTSIYGDLSINMIHAFNIHEKTGRAVFAFQDHRMVYRDNDDNYSSRFLHEGSFAMVQQHYPDAIVGQDGYPTGIIEDRDDNIHGIVDGSISGAYLDGHQKHYRHFPERFAAGLTNGRVLLNRGQNISDVVQIPFFGTKEVGVVEICQRKPEFIYVARNGMGYGTEELLVKSTNDASDFNPNSNWTSLSNNLIQFDDNTTQQLNASAAWRGIRTLAVDHFDENLVYCGMAGTYAPGGVITEEKFRVIKSTSGGEPNSNNINNAAWIDYSEGLPAIPVEQLLTVESDNQLIFCATSVGIYYRTASMSQWECFSEGLPKVEITGLQYDYCNNVLYASTYGRGLWKTDVNIPVVNTYAETIDQNELWDENKTIHTDVIVEAGNTLTITAIVRMAAGKNFIVEQGAHLIVDGGTLTNACGDFWEGIEIWGNGASPQISANQGKVSLKNEATIENAIVALRAYKLDNNGWVDSDYGGGIIYAKNANFLNNKQAVGMSTFQNTTSSGNLIGNRSYFDKCNFELNDDYLGGTTASSYNMVRLWKVDGVRFSACNFLNTRDVATSPERKSAISTLDANFKVNGKCSSIQQVGQPCPTNDIIHSVFDGFDIAVHARGAKANGAPHIRDSQFKNNMVGVHFQAVENGAAIFNEFEIGGHPFDPQIQDANKHLGIKVSESSEYTVEENVFEKAGNNGWDTHGALIEETGGQSSELYKNKFTDLTGASIGIGNNVAANNFDGLRFICNRNTGNDHDFELRLYELEPSYASFYQQGTESGEAAGNTFSTAANDNLYNHFHFNSSGFYEYRYDDNLNGHTPSDYESYVSQGDINHTVASIANNCPTNFPIGGKPDINYHFNKYTTARTGFNGLHYAYLQLIDEGNTQGMINEIDLSWPNDAWSLHAELMSRSPYNSEAVLISAINKDLMPHGMLLEILMANPDGLRSGNVAAHITCCMADPLPQYMMDILALAARDVQTIRTEMERSLSNLHLDVVRSHKQLLHYHLHDTVVGVHPDTLQYYYSGINNLRGRYQEMFWYVENDNYLAAEAILDTIALHYKLTTNESVELSTTEDFVGLLKAVHIDGRDIAALDSTEIADMLDISNVSDGGIAAARAENILCFFHNICPRPALAPKNNSTQARKPKPSLEELLSNENKVTLSPNPADHYVQIEYDLLFSKPNAYIRVMDVNGRTIQSWDISETKVGVKVIDTRKLAPGIYFYEITQEGAQIKSDKFMVQH